MPEKLLTPTQLFTLKEPTDLNTCLPGIYKIKSSNIKNTPTNGHGILISTEENGNSNMVTQIFFGLSGGSNTTETRKIYWRNKILSIWGNWTSY